jgi:hypothetical protein
MNSISIVAFARSFWGTDYPGKLVVFSGKTKAAKFYV